MLTVDQRKGLIEAALGRRPLDLIIRDVQVVNVYSGAVERGDVGVLFGRVVTTAAEGLQAQATFDGRGQYALPGFIDTHVHLDSTLLTPENLAHLIVPHGTTTMLADPMESSNVGGLPGLQALLGGADRLPYHLLVEVSSRVPTAPGLETTGGTLDLAAVQDILTWPSTISLGELDPSKVLGLQDEYLAKVVAAHALGKIANGHAAGLAGRELEAYACGGLADDHEGVDYADAVARLRLGMSVLVREGSTERNLDYVVRGVLAHGLDTRHLMFCTDDKHPDDIVAEGHIDYMVNRAISLGLPAMQAIQMATLNAAEHFRIDGMIGSLAPGRWADVIVAPSMERIVPSAVFCKGELTAREGRMVVATPVVTYPEWFRHTVKITRGRHAADFNLPAPGPAAEVRVIELYPDQIINRPGRGLLSVVDGNVRADPGQDILKLAAVERYGLNGNIGLTFVRGFGLKRGALASSVAHDHHNVVIVGVDEADMAACVAAVEEMQGGLAVAKGGRVIERLPLPLGGLMSPQPPDEVIAGLQRLTVAAHEQGCILPAPFMTLSFISLPTVPELGLTDKGLVDVRTHSLISTLL
jgi:adenine deaminase